MTTPLGAPATNGIKAGVWKSSGDAGVAPSGSGVDDVDVDVHLDVDDRVEDDVDVQGDDVYVEVSVVFDDGMDAAATRVRSDADVLSRARRRAHASLAVGSRSFRLAGRLLSARARDDAAVCYAFCRRADDRIDDTVDPGASLRRLRAELDLVYGAAPVEGDLVLQAFQEMVARRRIPRAYPAALLDGFAMDAGGARYATWSDLDLYCYRVAGVVGLMMTHVLGVHDERCLPAAVALGMAMQLTNIARDVAEDWCRGRLYVPACLLGDERRERDLPVLVAGSAPPPRLRDALRPAVAAMLARAAGLYRAAAGGFVDLPWRSAFAIRVAALVYSDIGGVIARRGFDPMGPRAVVSPPRKLWLVCMGALGALAEGPERMARRLGLGDRGGRGSARARGATTTPTTPANAIQIPDIELRYPDDIHPHLPIV